MENSFFITGVTGSLGTEIVSKLIDVSDARLYVLVRAHSRVEAERRLRAFWTGDRALYSAIGERIIPVVGDITIDSLGVEGSVRESLLSSVTHVIHCAAETSVQKSREDSRKVNVHGTANVLSFAQSMPALQRFIHISTAYVAGCRSGRIMEDDPLPPAFNSQYEESKAEAENLVRASGLPFSICRPGMIVGNSVNGRTRNFNTVYYALKLLLLGRLRFLPVSKNHTVNIAPADYVADSVVDLATEPDAEGKTFHLTAPAQMLPTVGELVDEVRKWAEDNLDLSIPRPFFMNLPFLGKAGKLYNAREKAKSRSLLSNLTALMPYFHDGHQFDRSNTDRLVGQYDKDWRAFLPVLLDFACRHNFMRITDKSIFQQAAERRESKRNPIVYYNISPGGLEEITGPRMNSMINGFVNKLKSLGVKEGDTVAISGINCAEHAALDSAIGLVGAISVPIYYTTPAEEVELLLRKSEARWFFVGDKRMIQNVGSLSSEVIIVPFGPLGSGNPEMSEINGYPVVESSQLATIRYTSGTTGEPKGVMFSFSQLKWMGEVLTNLLSWKDRNREMRYLSFLPMSHVVEGILASYAPYCMLCKAKIYYLNDFQQLTQALPKVRPTVFFSVPRFYEKLWEQIEGNALGRRYLSMKAGSLRSFTGMILRKAVLRKAGMDKCTQLIVGSAPVSEELLLKFRELGIEIHNAYGQTEAPLITINRLGDNVIPSIGTPLPETKVRVTPEGELIVSGPQVALGYYKLESNTFLGGELHTGDLGMIGSDGHVFIGGRKKDILITSYGKNINRGKIEQRLTDISGVDHAVLVGEQRPYCIALIWTKLDAVSLQEGIEKMNAGLSHPEQVKKWKVIESPLSIKNGELTPNLKVRREVVESHFSKEIEEVYNG